MLSNILLNCSAAQQTKANYIEFNVLTALIVCLIDTVHKLILCINTLSVVSACMSLSFVVTSDLLMRQRKV